MLANSAKKSPARFTIVFDIETNTLTNANPLIKARINHASVALRNKIYVLGGFSEKDSTWVTTIEKYDIDTCKALRSRAVW